MTLLPVGSQQITLNVGNELTFFGNQTFSNSLADEAKSIVTFLLMFSKQEDQNRKHL